MKKATYLVLYLSIATSAYGAVKEADWTEFKPPPEGAIAWSGSVNVGYQAVKDIEGEERDGVSTNTVINFSRPGDKTIGIDGSIEADRHELTTGRQENYGLSLGFKGEVLELSLGGDLTDSLNLIDGAEHQSRADSIKTGLKLNLKNFPISLDYSRSSNKNRQEDSTTQEVTSEDLGFSLGSKLGRVQTDLNLKLGETRDPIQDSITRTRGVGLISNIQLSKIFQLNLGVQPSETETIPEDESLKVTSKATDYTAGLTSQLHERVRILTNFGWNNSLCESQDEETTREISTQNYGILWQPFDPLSFNTNYNISDTKDANRSQMASANINYSPRERRFLGKTSLGYQTTKIEDDQGELQSESGTGSLNTGFNLAENMNLLGNLSNSIQKTYPLTGETSSITSNDLNLRLSHTPFKDLTYGLGYGLNEQEVDDNSDDTSRDTTNTYQGDINYNLKIGWRELPLCLTQLYTYSRIGEEEMETEETNASIRIPITKILSTSYAYGINRAKTETETETTLEETVSKTAGLELKVASLLINTGFTLVDSQDSDTESLSASLSYSILNRLSLNASFVQNRTIPEAENEDVTTSSNLTTGLTYTF